jgi:RNA polymerase sigma-70 factor, ECF subfamily
MSDTLGSAAEASLVALARAGDRPAFDELVRRRQGWIRVLLRSLCRNSVLADDLAQETFLKAWEHLRKLRAPEAFSSWLRQLAINSWRRHLRREGVFGQLAELEPGDGSSTHAAIERLDLDAALDALAPVARLCIVLSYHEGLSHLEIAAATELPLGTVKSHITRATTRLRELLAAYYPSDEQSPHER